MHIFTYCPSTIISVILDVFIIILQLFVKKNEMRTKVLGQAPHITTEYFADSRNRTPPAKVSLHVQKPKLQAKIKNLIMTYNKLSDVYYTIHKKMVVGSYGIAMLPPPPTKPITLP